MSTQARRELLVGVETLERCRGGQSGLPFNSMCVEEEFTESSKEMEPRARTNANSSGCDLKFQWQLTWNYSNLASSGQPTTPSCSSVEGLKFFPGSGGTLMIRTEAELAVPRHFETVEDGLQSTFRSTFQLRGWEARQCSSVSHIRLEPRSTIGNSS